MVKLFSLPQNWGVSPVYGGIKRHRKENPHIPQKLSVKVNSKLDKDDYIWLNFLKPQNVNHT